MLDHIFTVSSSSERDTKPSVFSKPFGKTKLAVGPGYRDLASIGTSARRGIRKKGVGLLLAGTTVGLSLVQPAMAQTAPQAPAPVAAPDDGQLADIIVTAQRRSERFEVPFADGVGTTWRFIEEFDTTEPVMAGLADNYIEQIVNAYVVGGAGCQGQIGLAPSLLVDAKPMLAFAVSWLEGCTTTA